MLSLTCAGRDMTFPSEEPIEGKLKQTNMRQREIDDLVIPFETRKMVSGNTTKLYVGTNGRKGSNSRTFLTIVDESQTDIRVGVTDENGRHNVFTYAKQIDVVVGGEKELDAFIDVLEYAAKALRKQSGRTKWGDVRRKVLNFFSRRR